MQHRMLSLHLRTIMLELVTIAGLLRRLSLGGLIFITMANKTLPAAGTRSRTPSSSNIVDMLMLLPY